MELAADPRPDDIVWPHAQWPPPPALEGASVVLTQFVPDDGDALFAAMDHDAVWEHVAGRPRSAEDYTATLSEAPSVGRWPWVVRLKQPVGTAEAGAVVGTTSYLDVSLADARLEVGWTAYSPSVWATSVNPETKLLLLDWAMGHGFGRVQMKTDVRNRRSQRAILSTGATYEGALRRYQRRADGTIRDTLMFSVIAEDWATVRETLVMRLE